MSKIIKAKAKAFTNEPMRVYKFKVDDDGEVRVYDSVAGHYVPSLAMSPRAEARIRKLAMSASR